MKHFFSFLMLGGIVFLSACNKSENSAIVDEGHLAYVSFNVKAGNGTKTTTAKSATEAQINTFDAFVFNSTGDLDAYGRWTVAADAEDPQVGEFTITASVASNEDRLSCTTGRGKKIYVIVNAPWPETDGETPANGLDHILTEAQLAAKYFMLGDNQQGEPSELSNFQMMGYRTMDFVPGDNNATISVNAVVARVELKKITRAFTSPALQAGAFQVVNIYLSNAVGKYGINTACAGTAYNAAGDVWYNKYAYDDTTPHVPYPGYIDITSAQNIFLNKQVASPVSIAEGASNNTTLQCVFYTMPNLVAWDSELADWGGAPVGGTSWSPRHTKIVIETTFEGTTYYYAIPVVEQDKYPIAEDSDSYEGLKANYSYEINELKLTRLGSINPDEPVVLSNVEFQISVNPWTQVLVANGSGADDGKYVI